MFLLILPQIDGALRATVPCGKQQSRSGRTPRDHIAGHGSDGCARHAQLKRYDEDIIQDRIADAGQYREEETQSGPSLRDEIHLEQNLQTSAPERRPSAISYTSCSRSSVSRWLPRRRTSGSAKRLPRIAVTAPTRIFKYTMEVNAARAFLAFLHPSFCNDGAAASGKHDCNTEHNVDGRVNDING